METTFEVSGEFSGVATTWMGTYWAEVRPDGSLYALVYEWETDGEGNAAGTFWAWS